MAFHQGCTVLVISRRELRRTIPAFPWLSRVVDAHLPSNELDFIRVDALPRKPVHNVWQDSPSYSLWELVLGEAVFQRDLEFTQLLIFGIGISEQNFSILHLSVQTRVTISYLWVISDTACPQYSLQGY
jgi:hypothetical protein